MSLPSLAADAPLGIRNLAPASHLYGIPRMRGTDILTDKLVLSFNMEFANNFTSDNKNQTAVFFDGETGVFTYGYQRGWRDFEWGVEVPYVAHFGGKLDGAIDEFHDLFGFKDGSRPIASRGNLDYFIRHRGKVFVDFQSSRQHIGDIRLWTGREIYASQGRALTGRGLIKLPTGKVKNLSGSEASDVSVWLEYSDVSLLADYRVSITAGGGIGYLGRGKLLPDAQRRSVFFGHLGVNFKYSDRLSLFAQLDSHSKLLDSPVTELSQAAIQGSLGSRISVNPNLWIDLGLMEDLSYQSAPDVVFQVLIGAKL